MSILHMIFHVILFQHFLSSSPISVFGFYGDVVVCCIQQYPEFSRFMEMYYYYYSFFGSGTINFFPPHFWFPWIVQSFDSQSQLQCSINTMSLDLVCWKFVMLLFGLMYSAYSFSVITVHRWLLCKIVWFQRFVIRKNGFSFEVMCLYPLVLNESGKKFPLIRGMDDFLLLFFEWNYPSIFVITTWERFSWQVLHIVRNKINRWLFILENYFHLDEIQMLFMVWNTSPDVPYVFIHSIGHWHWTSGFVEEILWLKIDRKMLVEWTNTRYRRWETFPMQKETRIKKNRNSNVKYIDSSRIIMCT